MGDASPSQGFVLLLGSCAVSSGSDSHSGSLSFLMAASKKKKKKRRKALCYVGFSVTDDTGQNSASESQSAAFCLK